MASFDLLFVGSGFSTSYTLIQLLGQLQHAGAAACLSVAVVESGNHFHAGRAFSPATVEPAPLLLTSLRSFLPETERQLFVEWFAQHPEAAPPDWAQTNHATLADGGLENLCVPRCIIGAFVQSRVTDAVRQAAEAGVAKVVLVTDRVLDLRPLASGYRCITASGSDLTATTVVLAVGSPPTRRLAPADTDCLRNDPTGQNSASSPAQIAAQIQQLSDQAAPHVLLVGGNASSMEMLYVLAQLTENGSCPTTFTVLTPSGRLPDRHDLPDPTVVVPTPALDALAASGRLTAEAICQAAAADLTAGRAVSTNFADVYEPVTKRVGGLLQQLGPDQHRPLADGLGHQLGKFTRWLGPEYADAVDKLRADGRLHVLAGTFIDTVPSQQSGAVQVRYQVADPDVIEVSQPAHIVINVAGAETVSPASSSPLLRSLAERYAANPSGRGLVVDDTFALDEGLFVMGPLLAGNVLSGRPVWHMEQASRIIDFSGRLAMGLAGRFLAQ
jgi:uncharacterized NAD(P)/FAD-binding protein YdhS